MTTPSMLQNRKVRLGLVAIAVAAALTLAIFQKSVIVTAVRPGDSVEVAFGRDYKLEPYTSTVKIAGSEVGVVSSATPRGDGRVDVSLKLDPGVNSTLGSAPSASIRPATVLGGKYFVELAPGGAPGEFPAGGEIPTERTRTPVELDAVLSAVPEDAQKGLQGTVRGLDGALANGAGRSLGGVAAVAPATLRPAGDVLQAARGTRPDSDLLRTVSDLNSAAQVLTETPGQLSSTVRDLGATARILGDAADPLATTIKDLPEVLDAVRDASPRVGSTLDRVVRVADHARPAVKRLDPLLAELEPAARSARPVVADLRPLLADARPLVHQLNPTVEQGTEVLNDLRGPVLDRVNGPIAGQLNDKWRGLDPKYPEGGNTGSRMYEEIGYTFANINNSVAYFNRTAHMLGFQPGAGSTSVGGVGDGPGQLLDLLSQAYGPPHQPGRSPLPLPPAGGLSLPGLPTGGGR